MRLKSLLVAGWLIALLPGCGGDTKPAAVNIAPAAVVQAESQTVTEAKAAFAKLQEASKAGNFEQAQKYISKDVLKPGQEDKALMAMGMLAAVQFDQAEADGDVVVLSKKEKSGGGTMSMSVVMVKEGGHWKLGSEDPDEDPASAAAAAPLEELKDAFKPLAAELAKGDEQYACYLNAELSCADGKLLSIDLFRHEIISCQDDTGKSLGSKKLEEFQSSAGVSCCSGGDDGKFSVRFYAKGKPAAEAKSLTLEGFVEVLHGTAKTAQEETIKLMRGSKVKFAGMPMRVRGSEQEKDFLTGKPVTLYELGYKSARKIDEKMLEQVTFADAAGNKIEGKIDEGSHWISGSSGGGTLKLKLFRRAPEVTISYQLWDAKRKKIPFKVTFPLQQ